MAGLAVALALPFGQSAGAAPAGAPGGAAAPGFTLSVVHEFPAALVQTPKYLALSKDGNLYGATSAVGSSNGTVFRLSGATYTTLATLDYATEGGPFGAPFIGRNGSLYGMTFDGGATGIGSIYTVKPNGKVSTVFAFNGTNGMYPTALTPAGAFRIVATFNGTDGTGPDELALGSDGALYGTTEAGGGTGGGVLFKLTLPH